MISPSAQLEWELDWVMRNSFKIRLVVQCFSCACSACSGRHEIVSVFCSSTSDYISFMRKKTSSNLLKNTEIREKTFMRLTCFSHFHLCSIHWGRQYLKLNLSSLWIKCHTGECYVSNNNGNKVHALRRPWIEKWQNWDGTTRKKRSMRWTVIRLSVYR